MNKIINILKEKKSIPLDKFINIALYDKKCGYYMKKKSFAKEGDYITAPLISNLFGEMIGVWCVAFWEHLGKPKKISIVELGSGDGSLCKILLDTFKNFKDFNNALEIKLLEKSDTLKKIQRNKIKNAKVGWIKTLTQLNYGPIIFLSNEFFDSLPIKQIYKKNDKFFEKHISLSKNNKKMVFSYKKATDKLIKNIQNLHLTNDNNIIEYPTKAIEYLEQIAKKVKKFDGGILTFDYGYTENINQETLQSVKNHKYINILSEPGNTDITSLINYNLFFKILKKNNLNVRKIVTQAEFLKKLGIIERANILSNKMNFNEKANVYYRLKRLLHHKEMGSLFKVLFAQNNRRSFSLGF
ncbi:SAM-dependent methyltransferase [Pelagibacteraceae bacterium]|nr:SAM-dependent methyltransferase [Pelagibacteraceae bacterium]